MSRNRFFSGLLIIAILACFLLGSLPGYAQYSMYKRLASALDISWATGGSGAVETFSYTDPTSGLTLTLPKVDASYLKFRAVSGAVEDLINGLYTLTLKAKEYIVKGPEVDARAYGSASQATIIAALADIGSKQKILVIYPNLIDTTTIWSLTADQTIPSNVTLKISHGAVLTVATTKTLTINGFLNAGHYQIFSCTGTGAVAGLKEVNPIWFGAVGDNSTACATAFNQSFAAMATTGAKWTLPGGQYRISTSLTITSKTKFTLEMIGEIVPYTTSNPGVWEVLDTTSPTGVLNIVSCSDFKIVPRFIQTDVANFGNGNIIYLSDCQNWKILDGTINVRCDTSVTSGKAAIRIGASCYDWSVVNNYLRAQSGIFAGSGTLIAAPYWDNIYSGKIIANTIVGNNSITEGGNGISIDGYGYVTGMYYYGFIISENNISNYLHPLGGCGIGLSSGLHSTITNNNITTVSQGIHCEDGSNDIIISGNVVKDAYRFAYDVEGAPSIAPAPAPNPSNNITLSNNKAYLNPLYDYNGTYPTTGIRILNDKGTNKGVNVVVDNCQVVNVHATRQLYAGIYFLNQESGVVRNCKVTGLARYGIDASHDEDDTGNGLMELVNNEVNGDISLYGILFNTFGKAPKRVSGNAVINSGTATADYYIGYNGTETVLPGYKCNYFGNNLASTTVTPTTLRTRNILAGTLRQNGAGIKLKIAGTTEANGNNKQIEVLLGSTTIFDTGATAANNKPWWFEINIVRKTATSQMFTVTGNWNGSPVVQSAIAEGTEDLDTTLALLVRATCPTANNDLRLYSWEAEVFGQGE